jgi:hypothetical protein
MSLRSNQRRLVKPDRGNSDTDASSSGGQHLHYCTLMQSGGFRPIAGLASSGTLLVRGSQLPPRLDGPLEVAQGICTAGKSELPI